MSGAVGKASRSKTTTVVEGRAGEAGNSRLVAEFVPLNRRRVQGSPPLSFDEFERLIQLRQLLECAMGAKRSSFGSARQALRVPADIEVQYGGAATREGKARAGNLSDLGAFIRTPDPLEPGALMRIELNPGDGTQPVQLEAVVRWTSPEGGEGPEGMGVSFQNLGPEEKAAILELVERLLTEMTGS
jgi:uncharacterized protein (TIGR02266 family)